MLDKIVGSAKFLMIVSFLLLQFFIISAECGDNICDMGESIEACPSDCGADEMEPSTEEIVCGDSICDNFEDSNSCPEDCGDLIDGSLNAETGVSNEEVVMGQEESGMDQQKIIILAVAGGVGGIALIVLVLSLIFGNKEPKEESSDNESGSGGLQEQSPVSGVQVQSSTPSQSVV